MSSIERMNLVMKTLYIKRQGFFQYGTVPLSRPVLWYRPVPLWKACSGIPFVLYYRKKHRPLLPQFLFQRVGESIHDKLTACLCARRYIIKPLPVPWPIFNNLHSSCLVTKYQTIMPVLTMELCTPTVFLSHHHACPLSSTKNNAPIIILQTLA